MSPVFLTLASVALVSLVSLAGIATLSWTEARLRRVALWCVSFAVGALLGDAFIHLIPETFTAGAGAREPLRASLWILAGMMGFFVLEKLLRHRHGALAAPGTERKPGSGPRPVLAAINVVGDALHNFVDGVLIAASYLVGPELGVSTTIAVLFHEIPQELGDFGVLIHSGLKVRQAVRVNLASASVAFLGAAAALAAGAFAEAAVTAALIPFAAGGFVYLAAADLIPELQHDHSLRGLVVQASLMALGIAIMGLLTLLD